MALTLAACSSPGAQTTPDAPTSSRAGVEDYDQNARNLAVIDGEGSSDLRAVRQRSGALDALQKKCPGERRSRIADYATVAKQQAKDEGLEVSTLQVLRGVNKGIAPSTAGKVRCTAAFVTYVVLVTSGAQP